MGYMKLSQNELATRINVPQELIREKKLSAFIQGMIYLLDILAQPENDHLLAQIGERDILGDDWMIEATNAMAQAICGAENVPEKAYENRLDVAEGLAREFEAIRAGNRSEQYRGNPDQLN